MKGYGKASCKNQNCRAEWPSVSQLRKERPQNDPGQCPKCKEPLTKRQATGRAK